jgi:hypothetical protein
MWRRLLVLTGIAALAAWFLRRERAEQPAPAVGPDPSEELRRRLDEARQREAGAGEADAVTEDGQESDAPVDLETMRRDVHDRARAAVDEMRGSTE